MDFRIRQLQCFLTLAELLNYGKTARALYMSQPAITFQIKSLEDAFNIKLFERDRQQVRLTEAGEAFREYAKTILSTVEKAQERMSEMRERMRLRISCGPVGQFVLLPSVIRALAADYPGFELEVSEFTTEEWMIRLVDGRLDALLMVGELPIKGLRFDAIVREPLVAMVSKQNPIARRGFISVEDFRDNAVIVSRLEDCRFNQPVVNDLLAPYGITPRFLESPQSCSTQLAYAASDEGIALATGSMRLCSFPHVVAVPFSETLPQRELGLAALESNDTPAMRIFRKVVLECAAQTLERPQPPLPRQIPIPQPAVAMMSRREAS